MSAGIDVNSEEEGSRDEYAAFSAVRHNEDGAATGLPDGN
jgi:hypothetical protein